MCDRYVFRTMVTEVADVSNTFLQIHTLGRPINVHVGWLGPNERMEWCTWHHKWLIWICKCHFVALVACCDAINFFIDWLHEGLCWFCYFILVAIHYIAVVDQPLKIITQLKKTSVLFYLLFNVAKANSIENFPTSFDELQVEQLITLNLWKMFYIWIKLIYQKFSK